MKIRRKHTELSYAKKIIKKVAMHPANQSSPAAAVARATAWQVYKRLIRRPFNVEIGPQSAKFRMFPDSSSCSNVVYFTWRFDFWESQFLVSFLRAGDCVVDCGANVGFFAVLAGSLVGPTGSVVAFEPFPENCRRARANVEMNEFHWVTVHQRAVSDVEADVVFVADMDVSNRIASVGDELVGRITVKSTRLDEVLPAVRASFWKLDIEGAEARALIGAERLLRTRPPHVIQVEVIDHLLVKQASSADGLAELLESHGYQGAKYDPIAGVLVPASLRIATGNVLAVHRDSFEFVQRRLLESGVTEAV